MNAVYQSPNRSRRVAAALFLGLCALTAVALALGAPDSRASPLLQGGSTDLFQAITVTADFPISDTRPYQGVTKTVYFSNSIGGILTLTVEVTGTPPLTLAAGAAFDEGERVYTSDVAPALFEVTYTVGTDHGSYPAVPYTATDSAPLTATVAISFIQDITAPVASIVSPAEPVWISTTLTITGTATDDDGAGVQWVEVTTGTVWDTATGTASWEYAWTPPGGQNGTPYTIAVRAVDDLSIVQSPAATRLITVDNLMTGTVGNLTSTTHITGVWSNQSQITVTWDAADDGPGIGLWGYAALWDTSPGTDPTAVNLGSAGTTTTITLTEGDGHYFHIRAVDGLGNWGPTAHLGPFRIDLTSPTVTVTTPLAQSVLTTTYMPSIPITGTASDAHSGVAYVEVTTGTSWVTATETAAWAYTWTLPITDRTVYTLTARAADNVGNVGLSAGVPVTVDTVAPTAAAPIPSRSPWVTSTWKYTWTPSSDGSGIAGYQVNITTTNVDATYWRTATDLDFTTLNEGVYYARVRAVDRVGNVGEWSDPAVVASDQGNPVVTVTLPSANSVLTTAHMSTLITGTASDTRSGVAYVEVTTSTSWVTATETAAWAYTWTLPITDRTVYTLTARAADNVGNVGLSAGVPVTVDTVAPTAAAPIPSRSPWVTSTWEYTWTPSSDGSGILGYWVNITGTGGHTQTFWVTEARLVFSTTAKESYYARVRAVDRVGNTGEWGNVSTVVTSDLNAPTVVVSAPVRVATTTFPISWSATDSASGVDHYQVMYWEDNGSWQNWIASTTATSATFVSATLEHTYTFRVTAYDRAGNAGTGEASTRVARWRVYIPLVVRNYPPPWRQASNTSNILSRTPSGCSADIRIWYAGTQARGIWKSNDNAVNWSQVVNWPENYYYPVTANPNDCDQAFASRWGQGVWQISVNDASPINIGLGEIYVYGLAITGNTLYAGTNSQGVYKTDIGNIQWQAANSGITDKRIRSLTAIGSEIYAGARGCRLYISTNAGASWSEKTVLSGGCDDAQVWSVAKVGSTLYAGLGMNKGLYASSDAGSSWQRVVAVPERTIYGLAHDSANGVLYVSVFGAGVYRCNLDSQGRVTGCTPHNIGLSTLDTYEIAVHGGRVVVASKDGIWYISAFR